MSRVVSRCVMPKTIEAQSANTNAALKWLSVMVIDASGKVARLQSVIVWVVSSPCHFATLKLFPSLLLPDRDVICISDRNKIQQSSDDHELCSVIRGCELDRSLAPIVGKRQNVERA
jgi:hypothetical protein